MSLPTSASDVRAGPGRACAACSTACAMACAIDAPAVRPSATQLLRNVGHAMIGAERHDVLIRGRRADRDDRAACRSCDRGCAYMSWISWLRGPNAWPTRSGLEKLTASTSVRVAFAELHRFGERRGHPSDDRRPQTDCAPTARSTRRSAGCRPGCRLQDVGKRSRPSGRRRFAEPGVGLGVADGREQRIPGLPVVRFDRIGGHECLAPAAPAPWRRRWMSAQPSSESESQVTASPPCPASMMALRAFSDRLTTCARRCRRISSAKVGTSSARRAFAAGRRSCRTRPPWRSRRRCT